MFCLVRRSHQDYPIYKRAEILIKNEDYDKLKARDVVTVVPQSGEEIHGSFFTATFVAKSGMFLAFNKASLRNYFINYSYNICYR